MERKRRVLLVIEDDEFPHDTRARNQARTLVSAGYQVSVIGPKFGPGKLVEDVDGVRVYRFPSSPKAQGVLGYAWEYSYSLLAIFLLSLVVFFRRGFDAIHAHNPPDILFLVALFYRPLGKRFLYDHHDLSPELFESRFGVSSGPVYRTVLLMERLSCKFAHVIVNVNQSCTELETGRCSAPRSKIFEVPNGPDLSRLDSLDLNGRRPSAGGESVLGYIGYMNPQDGVDYLLRALDHLVKGLGRQDFRCEVIGDGDEHEEPQAGYYVEPACRRARRVEDKVLQGRVP